MYRRILFILPFLALTACGGDDGTQPPENADVSGSWTYTAEGLTSTLGISCSFTGIQATIAQSGNSFSGTTQGGQWSCQSPFGAIEATPLDPQTILSGTLDGNNLTFEIDGDLFFSHIGAVSGNSMIGTATATGDVDPVGALTLVGSWTASR